VKPQLKGKLFMSVYMGKKSSKIFLSRPLEPKSSDLHGNILTKCKIKYARIMAKGGWERGRNLR
jgi:hypothetical protein